MGKKQVLIRNLKNVEDISVKNLMYKDRKKLADELRGIRKERNLSLVEYKSGDVNQSIINKYKSLQKKTDLKINEIIYETIEIPLEGFNKIILKKYSKKMSLKRLDLEYYNNLKGMFSKENLELALKSRRSIISPLYSFLRRSIEDSKGEYASYRESLVFEKFELRNNLGDAISKILEKEFLNLNPGEILFESKENMLSILDSVMSFKQKKGENPQELFLVIESLYDGYQINQYQKGYSNLVACVLENNGKLRDKFMRKINSDFKKGYSFIFSEWLNPKFPIPHISKKFESYLKKTFDIKVKSEVFLDNSRYFGNLVSHQIERDLDQMLYLDKERKGFVKILFEKYGIQGFKRYPRDLLIDQVENANQDFPYGIMVFAKDDHNGAFDYKQSVNQIYEGLGRKRKLRVFECSDKEGLLEGLRKFDSQYGKNNKISFLVLNAHGNKGLMVLGREKMLTKKDIQKGFLDEISNYFVDDAPVFFNSCSTGKEGGIAQEFSKLGFNVMAPDKPSSANILCANSLEKGLELKIKYKRAKLMNYDRGALVSSS